MTKKTWLLGAALAGGALLIGFAGASLAQGGRCNRDDVVCRMDVMERKLDRLLWLVENQGPAPVPASAPAGPVSVPTDRSCATDCVQEAVTVCQTAQFRTGVPETSVANGWGGRQLQRVTCYP